MGMEKKNWKHLFATIGTIAVDLGKLPFGGLILKNAKNKWMPRTPHLINE
jgi:hypothetical protein